MHLLKVENLLDFLVDEMENRGLTTNNFYFSIHQDFVDRCNEHNSINTNLDDYTRVVNQSKTQGYVSVSTTAPLSNLKITQKGLGVVYSNRIAKANDRSKTVLKRFSDFFSDHQGLLTFIGVAIAIVSLFFTIWGFK